MAARAGVRWTSSLLFALLPSALLVHAAPADTVACAPAEPSAVLPVADDGGADDFAEEAEELNVMLLQTQLRVDHLAKLSARQAAAGPEPVAAAPAKAAKGPEPKAAAPARAAKGPEPEAAALAQAVANFTANLDEALNRTASLLQVIANSSEGSRSTGHGKAGSLVARALDAYGEDSGYGGGGESWEKDPDDPAYVMEIPSAADIANSSSDAEGSKTTNSSGEKTSISAIGEGTIRGFRGEYNSLGKRRLYKRHHDDDGNTPFLVLLGVTAGITLCVCICASDSPLRRALESSHDKLGQTAAAMGPAAPAAAAAAQGVADTAQKQ